LLHFFKASRLTLGTTELPIWWPADPYSRGKATGVWPTHHHLVAMLRMNGAKPPHPHLSLWRVQKNTFGFLLIFSILNRLKPSPKYGHHLL